MVSLSAQMTSRLYLVQPILRLGSWLRSLAKKFLAYLKIALTYISKAVLKNVSRIIIVKYWHYDDITLKMFIHVVNNGDFKVLARSRFYDIDRCLKVWQGIMEDNAKVNGSNRMGVTADSLGSYVRYSATYVAINAMLTILQYEVNEKYIKRLTKEGYKIHMWDGGMSQQENNSAYADSIKAAFSRLRNVTSKIESKKKEIALLTAESSGSENKKLDFGEMLAAVSSRLGFQLNAGVLLSEYNGYIKVIKAKKK